MRHRTAGRQLSRTTSHRKALRRNMAASLIQHGAIRTTEPKAKELRRFIERIITIAKRGTLHARRRVIAELGDRAMTDTDGSFRGTTVVQKLFDEVAPAYADRPGGYTRIIRLDERRIGDGGSQVVLQLVGQAGDETPQTGKASRRRKRAAKRHQAAAAVAEAQQEQDEQTQAEQTDQAAEEQAQESDQQQDQPGQDQQEEDQHDQAEQEK